MMRIVMTLAAILLVHAAGDARTTPAPYKSLTRDFAKFHDVTRTMPEK